MTNALLDFASVVLGTALVFAGVTRVARAAGIRGRVDLFVVVPILAAAQIIGMLLFLGLLGLLDAVSVLLTTLVVSGALLVLVRPVEPRPRPSLRSFVGFARAHRVIGTLAVLAVLAIAWRVVLALVLPPYGYDPLHYHLPTVIGWVQSHRVSTSQLNTCCAYYPENGELLMTWPAVLGGGVEYVDLIQIVAALVGAAAVAGIARAARLRREGMVAAASLFLLTPLVLAQANTSDVDVTFTGTALAAYYLVLRALEAAGRRRWFLFGAAGVAAGLCVGVKPQGSEFLATLALPLVVAAFSRRRWPWRETGVAAALFAAPVAVLGVSWYIRSWLRTGSPYYPMEVKVGGVTIFHGTNHLTGAPPALARYPTALQPLVSWRSDLTFWTKSGYTLGGFQLGGLGPVWTYFGVIGVLLFAIYAGRRCKPVFWFFLVPTALMFDAQPDHWYSRYTIEIAAAGAVAVAWLMTASWRPRFVRLVFGVATLVLAGGAGWIATRTVLPTAGFANLGLKAVISDAIHGRRTVGAVFESSYRWIDKIHGEPIAVDPGSAQLFAPLAGRHFENQLVVLPPHTNLVRFVATHDVAYVAALKGSHYDRVATKDRGTFKYIGGHKLHGYLVLKRSTATTTLTPIR